MENQAYADQVESMSEAEIDALPIGVITLDLEGFVKRYNKMEANLAHLDQRSQIGKDFFVVVAPCCANPDFQGRFLELIAKPAGVSTFDYTFRFAWGHQRVHITFIKKAGRDEVDVLVTRLGV